MRAGADDYEGRRTVSKADDVAVAFVRGEGARSGSFVSHGDAIYSYDLRLATRLSYGGIVFDACMRNPENYEKATGTTTTIHRRALERAVRDHGASVLFGNDGQED
jgi:hypothetical protein